MYIYLKLYIWNSACVFVYVYIYETDMNSERIIGVK